jgi:predicted DsbA family dithiol-disulfide isomerase
VLAESMAKDHGAVVTWLPYDLHPEYPPEGVSRRLLRERYGPGIDDHTRALFERNGLTWSGSDHIPSSRDALRVSELARDRGVHDELHDRLMAAYWEHGEDLGDHDVLRVHADAVGLERGEVDDVLAGDAYLDRVRVSTEQAMSLGINGIPAFLLDSKLLVLGAQPREVFDRAFAQLGEPG